MTLLDRVLRRYGLVRVSRLPFRVMTVTHHHPKTWFGSPSGMTVDAVMRNGVHVTGDLTVVED